MPMHDNNVNKSIAALCLLNISKFSDRVRMIP